MLSTFRLRWRDGDPVTFFSSGAGSSALSSSRELFELAQGALGGCAASPAGGAPRRVKLDEYGEDAAAHDRGALEGGGGAEHEGDDNFLHGVVVRGARIRQFAVLRL